MSTRTTTTDMSRLLCDWNNHGVFFFENGEPEKAVIMFGGSIRMMEVKVSGVQMDVSNEIDILKAISMHQQQQSTCDNMTSPNYTTSTTMTMSPGCAVYKNNEDLSSANTTSQLCYKESIKIDPIMTDTTGARTPVTDDDAMMNQIVSFFQYAVTLYNTALVHHLVCSGERRPSLPSTAKSGVFKDEVALELYRMSFDFLLLISCQTIIPTSAIPSQILKKSQIMYMAILNNTALINFERGNLAVAKGCMDHLTLLVNAIDDEDSGYFLVNSIMFGATIGAASA